NYWLQSDPRELMHNALRASGVVPILLRNSLFGIPCRHFQRHAQTIVSRGQVRERRDNRTRQRRPDSLRRSINSWGNPCFSGLFSIRHVPVDNAVNWASNAAATIEAWYSPHRAIQKFS